jgi:DNA-binding transcriptional MerR regulator
MSRKWAFAMKQELTIGQVGRQSGLSRSTLLYYHRIGILRPVNRSGGNYRLYSSADVERLQQVCLYRKMGISLRDVRRLLERSCDETPPQKILQKRLAALEEEIEQCQGQQRQILRLLEQLSLEKAPKRRDAPNRSRMVPTGQKKTNPLSKENAVVSKQRWIEIMTAAGFSEQDMKKWHQTFERMEPQGHQEFLESLSISADEIAKIRQWSK